MFIRPPKCVEPRALLSDLLECLNDARNQHGQFQRSEADNKIIELSPPPIDALSFPNTDACAERKLKARVLLLSKLAAKATLHQLDALIKTLEVRNLGEELTDNDIALVQAIFNDHYRRIKHPPMHYTANPHGLINKVLIDIAKGIERLTDRRFAWLGLLIPSLKPAVAQQYSTETFRFKNVVLGQDDQVIIPVEAVKNQSAFERLPPGDKEKVLSQSPRVRALHLSRSQSGEFARASQAITIRRSSSSTADDDLPTEEQCHGLEVDLWLLDETASPTVCVDLAALNQLEANLKPDLPHVFSDKNDLCQFMLTHLPERQDWMLLMNILGRPVLDQLLSQSVSVVSANELYLAMWFSVNAQYKAGREAKSGEYTGCLPSLFRGKAFSKTAKLEAVARIMNSVERGLGFGEVYAELMKPENDFIRQSLSSGSLSKVNQPFMACAENAYMCMNQVKTLTQ
ncbi:MAG TPA: hypothetical protein VFU82_07815 [Gammaproteobacteria bacterium]|nr:hypothetical protein [Gammaproteobacteria bacterium]